MLPRLFPFKYVGFRAGPNYEIVDEKTIESETKAWKCPGCADHAPRKAFRAVKALNAVLLCVLMVTYVVIFAGLVDVSIIDRKDLATQRYRGGLKSDQLFGNIPMKTIVWDEDESFMDSDPMDGKWDRTTPWNETTPWDDLYRGAWIQLPNPSRAGISGGLPLAQFSFDGTWPNDGEGFAVSVLHQLHCVGMMKHVLMENKKERFVVGHDYGHATHCVEYLRQAVMCHGDLSIERPKEVNEQDFRGSTGWGSEHYCKDWSAVKEFMSSHLLAFAKFNGTTIVVPLSEWNANEVTDSPV